MSPEPRLLALSTAVPAHVVTTAEVMALARRIFADSGDFERLVPIYRNAGIDRRNACLPPHRLEQPRGWSENSRLFATHALALMVEATRACLDRAGLGREAIDAVVAVSTSGITTPSLDALLIDRLGLRADVERLPSFGLGCAGGVAGLARAAAMAKAAPGKTVLFTVAELCTLTFRPGDRSKSNIVATALFGDGAAAALIRCGAREGPKIAAWGDHTWPQSLDVMGWHIEDDGFGVLFSRDIPPLIRERLRPALDGFLARAGLPAASVDGYICHPGGAKVITALEEVLALPAGRLARERAVLREHGNMSAATVLFVLDRALADGLAGRHVLIALGPGFTASFLVLEQ